MLVKEGEEFSYWFTGNSLCLMSTNLKDGGGQVFVIFLHYCHRHVLLQELRWVIVHVHDCHLHQRHHRHSATFSPHHQLVLRRGEFVWGAALH